MAFSYTPGGGDRDLVRLLIGDTNLTELDAQMFQDAEVDALLTLEENVVRLAAAQALDTMASSEVMLLKVVRDQDLSTDGAAVSRELRARAAALRAQHEAVGGTYEGLFDWAEIVTDPFSARERLEHEALRSG